MTDMLVSVRLPGSLLEELKNFVRKNHYLDISEALRAILREKWEAYSDPYAYELRELRKSITSEMKDQIAKKSEQRLIDELKKMRERIRDEK
ncbi:hypothetical protein JXB11_03035 [Candidatus Woesearchaeota archaeon]|nr:hypothetical protein [Candidatus Woesearchaeota archaeon]